MKKKTSKIWTVSAEEFKNIVQNSYSITQCLSYFNLKNKGGNFRTIKSRIYDEKLDISHFTPFAFKKTKISIEMALSENSSYNRGCLKKRIINLNLIPYKCSECNLENSWNNKPLNLQLDHINGISNDNRLHNLRFLCPNCHSQTNTFAGMNVKKIIKIKNKVVKKRQTKCPDENTLKELINKYPATHIAKMYEVSDSAVVKWCKKLNIAKPGRGFWSKNKKG